MEKIKDWVSRAAQLQQPLLHPPRATRHAPPATRHPPPATRHPPTHPSPARKPSPRLVSRQVEVQKKDARFGIWTTKEVDVLNELNLLTAKKGIYLVNMSEKDYLRKKNKFLVPIHKWLQETKEGEKMVLYSAAVEQKLVDFTPEEKEKYCEEYKTKSQMGKIVAEGYAALGLIHFYTCGPDEVRAWTIRKGWKAPQAAGVIHTDFERGFIKAEVYNYEDWVANDCSEAAVKEKGKYRQEGKNYEVQDGDIIFFKFNVTADKKK
jgi:obg-like ATPase 1